MTFDPTPSLQHELHEFVAKTQARLAGLLESVNILREAASQDSCAAATLEGNPFCREANWQVKEQAVHSTTDIPKPALVPTAQSSASGVIAAAQHDERSGLDDAKVAIDRLEAIKRRLAEQIKKA